MAVNITTAVDSLVKLVNEKGKLSVEEASKLLKIPENIINEWAEFLEEEKILTIEYKFTTPYLIANKIIKIDDISKDDIDIIKRKLEYMLSFVKDAKVSTSKLIEQKIFLIENIKKVISKSSKKESKLKEEYTKLEKYCNIFKKSIK